MKKSELEQKSVADLRAICSEKKIKNYAKFSKPELIEKIYSLIGEAEVSGESVIENIPESVPTVEPEFVVIKNNEVSESGETNEETNEVVTPVSIEIGSEIEFTDYVGEEHTGIIVGELGPKLKVKAMDDHVVYTIATNRVKGFFEQPTQEEDSIEKEYKDKNGDVLSVGKEIFAKIKGVWVKAVILEFKSLGDEDYARVKVENDKLSKLINLNDISKTKKIKMSKKTPEETQGGVKTESKSDIIRRLLKDGVKPAEIAIAADCRVQMVYNMKNKK